MSIQKIIFAALLTISAASASAGCVVKYKDFSETAIRSDSDTRYELFDVIHERVKSLCEEKELQCDDLGSRSVRYPIFVKAIVRYRIKDCKGTYLSGAGTSNSNSDTDSSSN